MKKIKNKLGLQFLLNVESLVAGPNVNRPIFIFLILFKCINLKFSKQNFQLCYFIKNNLNYNILYIIYINYIVYL